MSDAPARRPPGRPKGTVKSSAPTNVFDAWMKKHNIRQADVARALDVTAPAIQHMRRPDYWPTREIAERLTALTGGDLYDESGHFWGLPRGWNGEYSAQYRAGIALIVSARERENVRKRKPKTRPRKAKGQRKKGASIAGTGPGRP
jgi:hypothetical protein